MFYTLVTKMSLAITLIHLNIWKNMFFNVFFSLKSEYFHNIICIFNFSAVSVSCPHLGIPQKLSSRVSGHQCMKTSDHIISWVKENDDLSHGYCTFVPKLIGFLVHQTPQKSKISAQLECHHNQWCATAKTMGTFQLEESHSRTRTIQNHRNLSPNHYITGIWHLYLKWQRQWTATLCALFVYQPSAFHNLYSQISQLLYLTSVHLSEGEQSPSFHNNNCDIWNALQDNWKVSPVSLLAAQ